MKSLTILVDLDSVVVDIDSVWFPEYQRRTGDTFGVEQMTEWDMKGAKFPDELFKVIFEPGFFLKPKPFDGAVDGLKAIVDMGHKVRLVSAGVGHGLSEKFFWVQRELPFLDPRRQLTLTHSKDDLKGDVIFDDGPHNIIAYRKAWPDACIATIEYPYNKHALGLADLVTGHWTDHAACWREFVAYIKFGAPRLYDAEMVVPK